MEKVVMKMSLFVVFACLMASASAQSATNVTAEYRDFNTTATNWNLTGLACYPSWGHKPLEWRSKYNWTEFGGPEGPLVPDSCGKCLKVTNTALNTSTTVRIVDACGLEGVILDTQAFDEIDTDGQGGFYGHLTVDYEFVDCHDKPDSWSIVDQLLSMR